VSGVDDASFGARSASEALIVHDTGLLAGRSPTRCRRVGIARASSHASSMRPPRHHTARAHYRPAVGQPAASIGDKLIRDPPSLDLTASDFVKRWSNQSMRETPTPLGVAKTRSAACACRDRNPCGSRRPRPTTLDDTDHGRTLRNQLVGLRGHPAPVTGQMSGSKSRCSRSEMNAAVAP